MKKKILSLCLVLALGATAIIGGTLAYFTDTDDAVNTFTTGNVEIDLTEAVVKADVDGNLIDSGARQDIGKSEDSYDYGKLYPGQTVFKDPTIENTGSEDAYIAAVITVTDGEGDLQNILGTGYENLLGIQTMISGGLVQENAQMTGSFENLPIYGDDTYHIYQTADKENGTYKFYIWVEDVQSTGDQVVLFDKISVPADWDNEQMAEMKELSIKVEAYATQTYGFHSCYEAVKAAFPDVFPEING